MAATVTLWKPETGEKKKFYTADAKEILVHEGSGWEIWSAAAEERVHAKVTPEPSEPHETHADEESAGFPENLEPDPLD